jgi:hypothetical protein
MEIAVILIVKNNYYGCSGKNSSINGFCFTWRLHAKWKIRVKRIKQDGWNLFLLFNQNRQNIGIEVLSGDTVTQKAKLTKKSNKLKTYEEREFT